LAEYLESLERVAGLEVQLILPSHGAPFSGHREWVRKARQHHHERCRLIEQAVAGGAVTTAHVVTSLWGDSLTPFHYRFAVFEALAHLEHLERRGRLHSRRDNGVLQWMSP
jgi:hypothetical protein